jgi:hypothetical protein
MPEKDENKVNEATEKMAEAVGGFYEAAAESTAAMRESNARLARSFLENSAETFEAQAELNSRAVQGMVELAREQQEAFRELSRQSLNAYDGFLGSLFSYYNEVLGEPEKGSGD